jgi:hypothetical protein
VRSLADLESGILAAGQRSDRPTAAAGELLRLREVAYRYNLVQLEPEHPETAQRLLLLGMVTRHLHLFVSGKLEVAELGDFCCSSRPVHGESA